MFLHIVALLEQLVSFVQRRKIDQRRETATESADDSPREGTSVEGSDRVTGSSTVSGSTGRGDTQSSTRNTSDENQETTIKLREPLLDADL